MGRKRIPGEQEEWHYRARSARWPADEVYAAIDRRVGAWISAGFPPQIARALALAEMPPALLDRLGGRKAVVERLQRGRRGQLGAGAEALALWRQHEFI